MKKKLALLFFMLVCGVSYSQSGVGTTTPHASAALDVTSTNKGLLLPRMTTVQRDAIPSPTPGLIIYNTTTNCVEFRNNTGWYNVCTGSVN